MAMVIVSAWHEDYTPRENTMRTYELLDSVRHNLTSELVIGKYGGKTEISVLLRGFENVQDAVNCIQVVLAEFDQICGLLIISSEPDEALFGCLVASDDTEADKLKYNVVDYYDRPPTLDYTMLTSGKYLVMKDKKCQETLQ